MTGPTPLKDYVRRIATPAVLSGRDPEGHPFSLRCPARIDSETIVRLHLPPGTPLAEGPAWLLWHRHDERLGELAQLGVRGELSITSREALFHVERVLPGPGLTTDGQDYDWGAEMTKMHQAAAAYMDAHGLRAPEIEWGLLSTLARQAAAGPAERIEPPTG